MGTEMLAIRDLLLSCPPVYTLPGTWTKCNAIIPHYNAAPNITFGISILVILYCYQASEYTEHSLTTKD